MVIIKPPVGTTAKKQDYTSNYSGYYFKRVSITSFTDLKDCLLLNSGFLFNDAPISQGRLGYGKSLKKEGYYPRSSTIFNKNSNVHAIDIEPNKQLKDYIDKPLKTIEEVEEFIQTYIKLPSYIISKSWSSIENPLEKKYRWHVWFVFDTNISLTTFSKFLDMALPNDSWYQLYTPKRQVVNLYCDTTIYSKARVFVEHPHATYHMVDNGLCSTQALVNKIMHYDKFTKTLINPQTFEEVEEIKQELTKKYSKASLDHFNKGYVLPSDTVYTPKGKPMKVQEVINAKKPQRFTAFHNVAEGNYNPDMQYKPDTLTFVDWTASSGGIYKILLQEEETIEFNSKYLPELDLSAKNIGILAPTGAGKTTAIKKQLKGKETTLFLVPTRAMVEDLGGLTSGFAKWKDLIPNDVNVMTLNKFIGHITGEHAKDISQMNVVIDEVHKCFTDPEENETHKLYDLIMKRKVKFKKLIYLSATFDFTLLPTPNLKVFKYISATKKPTINFLQNVNKGISGLINGRTLIFQESTEKNAALKDTLETAGLKVISLRGRKEDEDEQQVIPKSFEDYDVIIATSVLREGYSIKDHIDTVIIVNVMRAAGAEDLIQYFSRVRNNLPEIFIISASTHFKKPIKKISFMELEKVAMDLATNYTTEETEILQAINIDEFKRHVLTIDTATDTTVVNEVGLRAFYLKQKTREALSDKEIMTEYLKSYLHCAPFYKKQSKDKTELESTNLKEIKKRLTTAKTLEEKDEVIQILTSINNTESKTILSKLVESKKAFETLEGMQYLSEEQQVQYAVNQAQRNLILRHIKNINQKVYDVLNSSRYWKDNDTFTIKGLKRTFKAYLDKHKDFTDDEVLQVLKKVCRFEKLKEGRVVQRGSFDEVHVTHKTLIDLSSIPYDHVGVEVKGL